MIVTLRFFAQFGELLGNTIPVEVAAGTSVASLVREVAVKNKAGYKAIFNEKGSFHDYVILMQNRKRIRSPDAVTTLLNEGDEIAVFPPVAGG